MLSKSLGVLVALAGAGHATADCGTYFNSDHVYHVIDTGMGTLSEYLNHWTAANSSYVITYMNGTAQQTGTCKCTLQSDGSYGTVCTAEGPGIPAGSMGSMRTYDLPESAGGVFSCYNFGDKAEVPKTCEGAANFNFAKKIA
mmetsp:Transcript_78926/g.191207  ORF Transcript_78926/g.191207 Transcript_78926/m.191207 type:complete len:142 (+) Transcript_78926:52-477(+)